MIDRTPIQSPTGKTVCEYTNCEQIIHGPEGERFVRPIAEDGTYTRELFVYDINDHLITVKKFDDGSHTTGARKDYDINGTETISYFEFDKAHRTERGYYNAQRTQLKWEARTDVDNATIEQSSYSKEGFKKGHALNKNNLLHGSLVIYNGDEEQRIIAVENVINNVSLKETVFDHKGDVEYIINVSDNYAGNYSVLHTFKNNNLGKYTEKETVTQVEYIEQGSLICLERVRHAYMLGFDKMEWHREDAVLLMLDSYKKDENKKGIAQFYEKNKLVGYGPFIVQDDKAIYCGKHKLLWDANLVPFVNDKTTRPDFDAEFVETITEPTWDIKSRQPVNA